MSGERDLQRLLASMRPVLRWGAFVVAMIADESLLERITPDVIVRDHLLVPAERGEEALTLLCELSQAAA
jgi:hypothetical protein